MHFSYTVNIITEKVKIIKILPSTKKGKTQVYELFYEENFKEKNCLLKEKEIIVRFDIDKKEFSMILRSSLLNEEC